MSCLVIEGSCQYPWELEAQRFLLLMHIFSCWNVNFSQVIKTVGISWKGSGGLFYFFPSPPGSFLFACTMPCDLRVARATCSELSMMGSSLSTGEAANQTGHNYSGFSCSSSTSDKIPGGLSASELSAWRYLQTRSMPTAWAWVWHHTPVSDGPSCRVHLVRSIQAISANEEVFSSYSGQSVSRANK